MKTINKNAALTSFAITAVLFIFTIALFNITYSLNDDVMIGNLLSGRYTGTPEFMTYYFSVPLGFIISLLYKAIPVIPWLGVFYIAILLICFFLIAYRFLSVVNASTNKHLMSALYVCSAVILIYLTLFISNIVLIHYTIIASLVGSTGLLLLITNNSFASLKETIIHNLPAIALMLLCYLIRENVFFMLVPFFAVAGIYKLISFGKKDFKNYSILLSIFVGAFVIVFLLNRLPYSSAGWKEYIEYNNARTQLYDYVLISTDDSAVNYYKEQGIDDNTYDLYRSYNIMLDDRNLDIINKFSSYENEVNENRSSFTHFKEALYVYRHSFFNKNYAPLNIVIIALYLICLLLFISNKQKKHIFTLALLFSARSAMWMYLIWNDRYPERVTNSLMYMELLVLIGLFIDLTKLSKKLVLTNFLPMLTMLALLYGSVFVMQNFSDNYNKVTYDNNNDLVLFDYMESEPGNIYFMDVFTSVNHTNTVFKNQSKHSFDNYMILGGWMTESPLTQKRLDKLGISSIPEALVSNENVYLVMKENEYNGIVINNYEKWLNSEFKLITTLSNGTDKYLIYRYAD